MANESKPEGNKKLVSITDEEKPIIYYDENNEPVAYIPNFDPDEWNKARNYAETSSARSKNKAVQQTVSYVNENSPSYHDPNKKKKAVISTDVSPAGSDQKMPVIYMGPIDPNSGAAVAFSSKGERFICIPADSETIAKDQGKGTKDDALEKSKICIITEEIIEYKRPRKIKPKRDPNHDLEDNQHYIYSDDSMHGMQLKPVQQTASPMKTKERSPPHHYQKYSPQANENRPLYHYQENVPQSKEDIPQTKENKPLYHYQENNPKSKEDILQESNDDCLNLDSGNSNSFFHIAIRSRDEDCSKSECASCIAICCEKNRR